MSIICVTFTCYFFRETCMIGTLKITFGAPLPDDLKVWEDMKPVGREFRGELTIEELDDIELSKIVGELKFCLFG